MGTTRVLVIVAKGEARQAYERELTDMEVDFDMVATFEEVRSLAGFRSYNGMLLDMVTLVKSPPEEKAAAYELINYFPSTRVKWDPRTGQTSILSFDSALSTGSSLGSFIESKCRRTAPRSLRKYKRKDMVLHLRLGIEQNDTVVIETKTFCINLSREGAYIQQMEPFSRGQLVWLQFLDLFERAPVEAEVCWSLAWGEGKGIPGMGVKFLSLTEEQRADLVRIL